MVDQPAASLQEAVTRATSAVKGDRRDDDLKGKHVPRGRKKAKTTGDEEEEAGGSSSGSSSDGEEEEEAPSTGGAGAVGGYHNAAGFANLQGI